MSNEREFDVVIFGATGFTGKLVAEYFQAEYGSDDSVGVIYGSNDSVRAKHVHFGDPISTEREYTLTKEERRSKKFTFSEEAQEIKRLKREMKKLKKHMKKYNEPALVPEYENLIGKVEGKLDKFDDLPIK